MAEASSWTIETKQREGSRLRAVFLREGDVFLHDIELVEGDRASLLLNTAAPNVGGDWPLSPPWQELHEHQGKPGGPAILLLVGRAGTSHWSMAVGVDESQCAIVFDVACRIRSQPEFLGTTYDDSVGRAQQAIPGAVELCPASDDRSAILLKALEIGGERLPLVEIGKGRVVVKANADVPPPATIRWKYCVGFAD